MGTAEWTSEWLRNGTDVGHITCILRWTERLRHPGKCVIWFLKADSGPPSCVETLLIAREQ